MTASRIAFAAATLVLSASLASAASTSGTVNNKTTGKTSSGDTIELIDVQASMSAVAKTTSDAKGHYTLNMPGAGPYLVRVTHQGAPFFIAAGGPSGDVNVYDVKAKVDGVSIEDQIFGMETQNGQLVVTEQFVVHNTSSPAVSQFSDKPFEFVLPDGAVLDAAEATRPTGMPTMAMPKPLAQKNHYTFTIPIDPDASENKMTIFQVQFHLPYSGSYTFKPTLPMPVDNFVVQLPKAMSFKAGDGLSFQSLQRDPSFQIFLLKNAQPSQSIAFTVSGEGSAPREAQGGNDAQQAQQSGPGGGIGEPINQPDPLSKYKWWILGAIALVLVAVAAYLLRKPTAAIRRDTKIGSNPLLQRYLDAYRIANGTILLGTIIKWGSVILAAIIIIASATESKSQGELVIASAIAFGIAIAIVGFALGVMISAQGQIMLATVDTAVNTSPFATMGEKAKIIGIESSDSTDNN